MREDRNCQWRVAARPVGNVKPSDFEYAETDIPEPGDGEFLLKTLYLGLAPVMRMYMQGTGAAGERPLEIGDVIHGRGVAQVVKSRHPGYRVGDIVQGQCGWQTWKVSRGTPQERFFTCRDYGLPYALAAGVLGMTGLSAWGGFMDCGQPREGDLVVVSGAAGGVGSLVVQMARIRGCRVIGIAGGKEKCRFIQDLGCEAAIDYKGEDVPARITELCPDGIDIYFDNVGGETLAACLEHLAYEARVVLCGSISEYTRKQPFCLPNYTRLRAVNGTMKGFFVYNYADRFHECTDQMAGWINAGQMRPVQDMVDGFDNMPDALARLYDGRNVGVQCCRVRGEPAPLEA
ncbi:MAG: NADP-dependent oxidoreductase [Lysobacterales bacterium]